jgi:hypothetical protein
MLSSFCILAWHVGTSSSRAASSAAANLNIFTSLIPVNLWLLHSCWGMLVCCRAVLRDLDLTRTDSCQGTGADV